MDAATKVNINAHSNGSGAWLGCRIGAGPAGLTAASELAMGGAEVEVFEADRTVGRLCCRTISLRVGKVDLGAHRLFSCRENQINSKIPSRVGTHSGLSKACEVCVGKPACCLCNVWISRKQKP